MRILITNDDGINAPGLAAMEAVAAEIAGPDGEVWTVAPAFEQSGVGHCISYSHPTMLAELAPRRFAAEGTPADCVLAGLYEVMSDGPPDLVLSGVNRGNNTAQSVVYSGTVGAAMEGALQGVKSIALSQFYGPANKDAADPFEAATRFGADLVRALLENADWDDEAYRVFYNVNLPPVLAADVKGVRVVAQGWRKETDFAMTSQVSPTGRTFLWVTGGPQHLPTGPGTDVTANLDGYISITPLIADLTDHSRMAALAARFDADFGGPSNG